VACAAGPGLADLFIQAGAVVVEASPGRRPDTSALLQAIRGSGGGPVVVLPNDPQTQLVAEAAAAVARREGIRVTVLPTRAQVQGLAAVAVHDPSRGLDDDVVRMSSAAAAARDGAVTVAVRDAMTTAGPCRVGDALGVVQGDFVIVGSDLGQVAHQVLDRLLSGGGELVTLVTGIDADPELVRAATEHVRRTRFDVEVHVLDGGQERYPLLLGVE
jgi:dihydroxyacetone kinase-like predicted kinase